MEWLGYGISWGDLVGLYEKCKKALGNKWEEFLDFYASTCRADPRIKAEWREACGVKTNDEIDYNNPVVEISYQLCDLRNMKLIYKGRHREEFLEKLSPEARIAYFQPFDDGGSFLDCEHPSVFKGLMHNLRKSLSKYYRKLRKEGKISNQDIRRIERESSSLNFDDESLTSEDD